MTAPPAQAITLSLLGTYVRPARRTVWSGGLVLALEDLGVAPAAARVALSRLTRRELLKRDKRGRVAFYALTDAGHRLLEEGTRRIFTFGTNHAGGSSWTVLSYSVPERQRAVRDALRKRLRFLGFASTHDGVWFSPRDHEAELVELLGELGLRGNAEIFVGRPAGGVSPSDLIRRGWDLGPLRQAYADFLAAYRPIARRRLSDREAFVARTRIVHDFRRFPPIDPELPEDLLPEPIQRSEAVGLFHEIYDALAPASEAYFEARTHRSPSAR